MATMGYFEQISFIDDLFFTITSNSKIPGFKVLSFKDGIVEIDPLTTSNIEDVLDAVMGCFETRSNFFKEVTNVYYFYENPVIKGIRFTSYDVTIEVTVDTTDKYMLLSEYWKKRYYDIAEKYNHAMLSLIDKIKIG